MAIDAPGRRGVTQVIADFVMVIVLAILAVFPGIAPELALGQADAPTGHQPIDMRIGVRAVAALRGHLRSVGGAQLLQTPIEVGPQIGNGPTEVPQEPVGRLPAVDQTVGHHRQVFSQVVAALGLELLGEIVGPGRLDAAGAAGPALPAIDVKIGRRTTHLLDGRPDDRPAQVLKEYSATRELSTSASYGTSVIGWLTATMKLRAIAPWVL